MIRQRTIKKTMQTTGIGLHGGRRVTVQFYPAPANTGIVYRRVDLKDVPEIKADPFSVANTALCSTLVSSDGISLSTIEHFSAALAGLGIDNLYVDVDAPELPIMDGSAYPFLYILQLAGIEELTEAKRFIKVKKNLRVMDDDKWLEIAPKHDGFYLDIELEYTHPVIKETPLRFAMDFSTQNFITEISRARTYCLKQDIEYMYSQNLARGGSLENAVVVDDFRIINTEGLRYPDEFVKHKWLDVFGDLYLCNHALLGHVKGYKVGHALNNKLITTLLSDSDAWEWCTVEPAHASDVARAFTARNTVYAH